MEQAQRGLGLWNDSVRMTRYRQDLWEGRAERDLVVRREREHHPRLQALLVELHRRYLPMVRNHIEVDFDQGFPARVGM